MLRQTSLFQGAGVIAQSGLVVILLVQVKVQMLVKVRTARMGGFSFSESSRLKRPNAPTWGG